MITKEQIEEAAKDIAEKYSIVNHQEHNKNILECLFKEGARWAIDKFLESLWHDAKEEPNYNRLILYEFKPNGEIYPSLYYRVASNPERERWKYNGYKPINPERIITRWLYTDELFTKKGGKQ